MGAPANRSWQTLLIGVAIAVLGLVCMGGGLALLAYRLFAPDQAVLLPPGLVITPQTPTPGLLGRPLPAPRPPQDPAQVVILPESALPTSAPIGTLAVMSPMPGATRPPRPSATISPSPVHTRTAPVTPLPTQAATPLPSPTAPTIPDRIVIDAIGLDAPVIPVGQHPVELEGQLSSQWDVPDWFAAGWHQNSAPLGQPGNTVINGHHNIYGEVFRDLVALQPGDAITLGSGMQHHTYIVSQTMTLAELDQPLDVRRDNARWILPTADERVTLITCWPYSANSHRLVVIAQPLSELRVPAELP